MALSRSFLLLLTLPFFPTFFLALSPRFSCSSLPSYECLLVSRERHPLFSIPTLSQTLRTLDLEANKFTRIPDSIGDLAGLTELNLTFNGLRALPDTFLKLNNLQVLELADNPALTALPEWQNFPKLRRLNLRNVQIQELSPTIGVLVQVRFLPAFLLLSLSFVPIPSSSQPQLEELELRDNSQLQQAGLPEELGQLVALRRLDLYGNRLRTLPLSIGRLRNLTILDIRNNMFTIDTFPPAIGNLPNLQKLFMSANKIGHMPEQILQIKSLSELDISNNELHQLPEGLGQLVNLKKHAPPLHFLSSPLAPSSSSSPP